jgi:hypothetical protein
MKNLFYLLFVLPLLFSCGDTPGDTSPDSNTKLTKENDKLKTDLGELTQQNLELEAKLKAIGTESNSLKDLIKWEIKYFEGVVTLVSEYDMLGIIDVKLNDGAKLTIYTTPGDGLTWKDIEDRNPPMGEGCRSALAHENGSKIKGYIGKGYFGGYGHPSGLPEHNIPDGMVNRLVYVENY